MKEGGELKVTVPGLCWYTETPERRFTPLNSERAEAPKDPGPKVVSYWVEGPRTSTLSQQPQTSV